MSKLEAQYKDLAKAFKSLREAVLLPSNIEINRDGTLQRFEFTFELCWKILQTIVNENLLNVYGPKNVIREAAKLNLIDDPVIWFKFLENRNLISHTYNELLAKKVYKAAKDFPPYVESLMEKVKDYISKP